MWADAFIRFLFSPRNSVQRTVVKYLASLWVVGSKGISFIIFLLIKQLHLSRETSTRKATREKKISDADTSVSDALTLIGGFLNDYEI